MLLNIKEQQDCQNLGISDDQCCKQAMSARYGSNLMKHLSLLLIQVSVIKPVLEIVLIRNNAKSSYTT